MNTSTAAGEQPQALPSAFSLFTPSMEALRRNLMTFVYLLLIEAGSAAVYVGILFLLFHAGESGAAIITLRVLVAAAGGVALAALLIITNAAVTLTQVQSAKGKKIAFKPAFEQGKQIAWRVFCVSICAALLIVLGFILLIVPGYKKIKLAKKPVSIAAKNIDEVIANLRTRTAEKKDVDRAAKNGDQVYIDFIGVDAKTKEPINGADGKNYPLVLGSNTFIPGFEPELVGLKVNDEKTFTVTFPKDYGVKALQGRKVSFTATVLKVQEVVEPKVDDAFAATVGPFKTIAELKADIKKQLQAEQEHQAERAYADELITKISEASKVAIPETLINEQIDQLVNEQKQNLVYRGQTWQEFLKDEGKTEQAFRNTLRKDAEQRVKAGLILSEIADAERIFVTPEELEVRMQLLKGQYTDARMLAELEKPEARREIASRLKTEKTVAKLTDYAQAQ